MEASSGPGSLATAPAAATAHWQRRTFPSGPGVSPGPVVRGPPARPTRSPDAASGSGRGSLPVRLVVNAQVQLTNLQAMYERGTATSDQRRQLDLRLVSHY